VSSTTKGVASLAVAVAASRGLIDYYDAKVATTGRRTSGLALRQALFRDVLGARA